MISARELRLARTVTMRHEASEHISCPEDAVLVERGRPRTLILLCPCGCGEELAINLDGRVGPAWQLYRRVRGEISLYLSVWRESGCKSHFILWRGSVLLFDHSDDDLSLYSGDYDTKVADQILALLPAKGLISFTDLSETLDLVPWDVLTTCRRLVRLGLAREGKGRRRGSFGRR
jgi:hypothetical protein